MSVVFINNISALAYNAVEDSAYEFLILFQAINKSLSLIDKRFLLLMIHY